MGITMRAIRHFNPKPWASARWCKPSSRPDLGVGIYKRSFKWIQSVSKVGEGAWMRQCTLSPNRVYTINHSR